MVSMVLAQDIKVPPPLVNTDLMSTSPTIWSDTMRKAYELKIGLNNFRVVLSSDEHPILPINLSARGYPLPIQAEAELSFQDDSLRIILRDKASISPLVDGGTWGGDHWELFFANQRDKPYRQMGVSATGSVAEVAVGEAAWKSGYTLHMSTDSNGWITTLELPLATLLPGLTSNSTFYMNILRCPNGDGEPAFWSPVFQGGYHCPTRMGIINDHVKRVFVQNDTFHLSLDCDDIDAPVKLLFPGGKPRAVALSFDDGLESDKRFIQILKKYDMKATFHVPVSCQIPTNEIGTVYAGHEVAVHQGNGEGPAEPFAKEIVWARDELSELTGQQVGGLAYQGGAFTEESAAALEKAGIVYARTIATERWFCLQTNRFLMLNTSCHESQANQLAKTFLEFPGKPALMSVWGHTFEFKSEADWQRIEDFCKMVGKRDDMWYASLLDVVVYTKAALRLEVDTNKRTIHNPTKTQIFIEGYGKVIPLDPGVTWGAIE